MHRRPNLKEALDILSHYSDISIEAAEMLAEYKTLCENDQEFFAARLVVEVVDHFYHINDVKGVFNG